MNCLMKAYETSLSMLSSGHTVLIAHAIRDILVPNSPHAFNIDVCCNKVLDNSDANPFWPEINHKIEMDFEEFIKLQKIEMGFKSFKTYTFKEYNQNLYGKWELVHGFHDLAVFSEKSGRYIPILELGGDTL